MKLLCLTVGIEHTDTPETQREKQNTGQTRQVETVKHRRTFVREIRKEPQKENRETKKLIGC